MHDDYSRIDEGSHNADHKQPIVTSPYAVIEPHTVMVKLVHAAVATAAVFAVGRTVAVAELAEENFAVVWSESNLAIVTRPFVEINYSVGGVADGGGEIVMVRPERQ
jgi:ribonucleotide monophosphatase NagD (HAD superfamily)